MIRGHTHRRLAVMGLALVVIAVLSGCSETTSDTPVPGSAAAISTIATTMPPAATTSSSGTGSTSMTTTTVPPPSTTISTTVVESDESTLYIDFYWARTYGITVPVVDGEIRFGYGEITVADGFDVPPVLRITAQDIEAATLGGAGLDLDLSEEMCAAFGNLMIEGADDYVFRVTVDEETAWGWNMLAISPVVPEIAYIHSLYGCMTEPADLVLRSRSTTIGGVPLSEAIEEAWLRAQEQ